MAPWLALRRWAPAGAPERLKWPAGGAHSTGKQTSTTTAIRPPGRGRRDIQHNSISWPASASNFICIVGAGATAANSQISKLEPPVK